METKNPSLLLKFTSFLRDIGSHGDDSDQDDSEFESASGSLRDRLQRKHHEDQVRSNEFKQLRARIEQRQPDGGNRAPTSAAKPAAAQRTSPANTPNADLQQWWGGAPATAQNTPATDELDLDFTTLLTSPTAETPPSSSALSGIESIAPFDGAADTPDSGIDQSLRDAAVNYAQGDFTAAEKEMLAVLATHTLDSASVEMLTFALFDIYRATGQKERFEAAALDYAERHGRSPAEWFSIPEQLAAQQKSAPTRISPPPTTAASATPPRWRCPHRLDTTSLVRLQTLAATPDNGCPIDWSDLQSIDTNTGTALATLVRHWCNSPQRLNWTGVNALLQALELHTRQASARGDPLWWTIHMDMLCILRQPDAFETLALDYCVAFEVSPPAWIDVRCQLEQDQPGNMALTTTIAESHTSEDTPHARAPGRFNLTGDLCGASASGLQLLQSQAAAATIITVACGLLRRVDEKAAQSLLHWAKQTADRGCTIQFVQVPRLVLVFMLILGLDQYAELSTRIN